MTQQSTTNATLARRDLLTGTALAAAGSLFLNPIVRADEPPLQNMKRQALHPPGAPAADAGYSPALLAQGQRVLFISGQGSKDHHADMETQIRQTFDRISILLKAAGASFANVVMMRSYWLHLQRDLPIFRKVRREYLVQPYPAATAVGTPELASPDAQLEIEVVAIL
ncbi:MAG TPA: Rid family hydrolase [Lacipirellulaceae bacterium]|nr:Rid family hydrolase [Lacipirellulaceae bacterium]